MMMYYGILPKNQSHLAGLFFSRLFACLLMKLMSGDSDWTIGIMIYQHELLLPHKTNTKCGVKGRRLSIVK